MGEARQLSAKKENKDKILVFDSLFAFRFLTREQLTAIDINRIVDNYMNLFLFINIYITELALAKSVFPLSECCSELDDIISQFRSSSFDIDAEGVQMLRRLVKLLRNVARKRWESLASGILALFSIYLLVPHSEATYFGNVLFNFGLPLLIGLVVFTAWTVWVSFSPTFPSK